MLKPFSSSRLSQCALIIVATVVILVCATGAQAQGEKQDDRWHFTIVPYLWAPSVNGTLKYGPPPRLDRW